MATKSSVKPPFLINSGDKTSQSSEKVLNSQANIVEIKNFQIKKPEKPLAAQDTEYLNELSQKLAKQKDGSLSISGRNIQIQKKVSTTKEKTSSQILLERNDAKKYESFSNLNAENKESSTSQSRSISSSGVSENKMSSVFSESEGNQNMPSTSFKKPSSVLSESEGNQNMPSTSVSRPQLAKPRNYERSKKIIKKSQESTDNHPLITGRVTPRKPPDSRQRQRLRELQETRGGPLYVQCCKCKKWRLVEEYEDPVDVPKMWTCPLHPDEKWRSCDIPEEKIPPHIAKDLICNKYTAGSLVWAKVRTFPWWPAMVDDCPEVEQYYWLNDCDSIEPTFYHVVFFDSEKAKVTHKWIPVEKLISFKHNPNLDLNFILKTKPHRQRINDAKEQANKAMLLRILERLKTYSFLDRWPYRINTPVGSSDSEDEFTDAKQRKKRRHSVKALMLASRKKSRHNLSNGSKYSHVPSLSGTCSEDSAKQHDVSSAQKVTSSQEPSVSAGIPEDRPTKKVFKRPVGRPRKNNVLHEVSNTGLDEDSNTGRRKVGRPPKKDMKYNTNIKQSNSKGVTKFQQKSANINRKFPIKTTKHITADSDSFGDSTTGIVAPENSTKKLQNHISQASHLSHKDYCTDKNQNKITDVINTKEMVRQQTEKSDNVSDSEKENYYVSYEEFINVFLSASKGGRPRNEHDSGDSLQDLQQKVSENQEQQ